MLKVGWLIYKVFFSFHKAAFSFLLILPSTFSLPGVAPPSFVAIKAGTTLYQLTTAGEAVSWNSLFVLMILAILSILPALFQKKLKQKFE